MNFFGKIFLSIMLMSLFFFSFGVFYFIHSSFEYSLEREASETYEENDILLYTIKNEVEDGIYDASIIGESGELNKSWIANTMNSVTIKTSKGAIPFRISDSKYRSIYERQWPNIEQEMLKKLSSNTRGYEITLDNGMHYIHAASPITILGETLYVENYRNITDLFENRNLQYQTCFYFMIIMFIMGAGITFVVAMLLTKPIRRLSGATRRFESGDFSQRVQIKGTDELSMLAKDFNSMAARVEQTIEELKDSAQRQEDFVNNFAHELKTPLTSIIGYADMIRSKKLSSELIVESANYIFGEGKHLEALSMKLMDIIIIKNQMIKFEGIEICQFLQSIEGAYRPVFESKNIEFVVQCQPMLIKCEPDLIKTVCVNLLDNARKAVNENGKVTMTGKVEGQDYLICVEDNGIGMSQAELTRITEAFYMIDKSRTRAQGGAGLGLAICSEIMKMHGGTLSFRSQPQKGTCATIYLKGDPKNGNEK